MAVEFGLVLPLLLMIIFVIIEFGHAYNVQISVTHAAREAARTMAITQDWSDAQDAAVASSPSLSPGDIQFPSAPSCVAGAPVEVVLTYPLPGLTGLLPSGINVTGKAAMQCGG
ncbi:TadE/TadG family type IV pilus assembly protein [Kocuria turfanensis]|uniref:TadE/TadG family type IV pilus assembly protein n=1 Tax=Kocuria turfanensis TaxID=388357 RepID=UPI004036EE00